MWRHSTLGLRLTLGWSRDFGLSLFSRRRENSQSIVFRLFTSESNGKSKAKINTTVLFAVKSPCFHRVNWPLTMARKHHWPCPDLLQCSFEILKWTSNKLSHFRFELTKFRFRMRSFLNFSFKRIFIYENEVKKMKKKMKYYKS